MANDGRDAETSLSALARSLREAGVATHAGPTLGDTRAATDVVAREEGGTGPATFPAPPILAVRDLDVSFRGQQVLFGVDLDVASGEVLALLGTNGAGKSTVLRAISGLVRPDRGSIRFRGRSLLAVEAPDRVGLGVVQVPGGRGVFAGLSVLDNLLVGCHRFAWDRARVQDRIERALSLFPRLGERLDQVAGSLSGGEQQMLSLAKALLVDPIVLLIDELSLGLAPVVVQELLGVIAGLKAAGTTIVVVEQSLNVALSIADRAVWMEKGSVRFEGPATELVDRGDLVRAVFLGGRPRG